MGGDEVGQTCGHTVQLDQGAAVGVCAHPQLGLGHPFGVGQAKQGGEGYAAAPLVMLNRVGYAVEGVQAREGPLVWL